MSKIGSFQVRHMYVANGTVDTTNKHLASTAKVGDILVKSNTKEGEIFLEYKGAKGVLRSGLIKVGNILSSSVTKAAQMARPITKKGIFLKSSVNSGSPVGGQDYVVSIEFNQFGAPGDDSKYYKHAAVHAYQGMTADEFAVTLAVQLKMNFSREAAQYVDVYLANYDGTDVTLGEKIEELTTSNFDALRTLYGGNNANGVVLVEKVQYYEQGVYTDLPVLFNLWGDEITVQGEALPWAEVVDTTIKRTGLATNDGWSEALVYNEDVEAGTATGVPNAVGNGRQVADMEWGATSARGDYQKDLGWPERVKTYYLVDENARYDIIDIHYYTTSNLESVQRSEKTITVAVPEGKSTALVNQIKAKATAINSAVNLFA